MEDVMLEQARQVLRMEAEAVLEQVERIDEHFKAAVEMIMACPGRTVITGMGKSGIIGRKWQQRLPAPARLLFTCTRQKAFTATWVW